MLFCLISVLTASFCLFAYNVCVYMRVIVICYVYFYHYYLYIAFYSLVLTYCVCVYVYLCVEYVCCSEEQAVHYRAQRDGAERAVTRVSRSYRRLSR